MTFSTIFVRFTQPGFHHWPDPTPERAYLGQRHRHLFHVEVRVQVWHDDREVEFHDLLDFARSQFPGGELGGQSCETMARALGKEIARRFGRAVEVTVSEDGEVGAVVVTPRPAGAAGG
jgi:hypothetical protein